MSGLTIRVANTISQLNKPHLEAKVGAAAGSAGLNGLCSADRGRQGAGSAAEGGLGIGAGEVLIAGSKAEDENVERGIRVEFVLVEPADEVPELQALDGR